MNLGFCSLMKAIVRNSGCLWERSFRQHRSQIRAAWLCQHSVSLQENDSFRYAHAPCVLSEADPAAKAAVVDNVSLCSRPHFNRQASSPQSRGILAAWIPRRAMPIKLWRRITSTARRNRGGCHQAATPRPRSRPVVRGSFLDSHNMFKCNVVRVK